MITVGKSTCFYRLSQVDPEVAYLAKSRYKSTRLTRPIDLPASTVNMIDTVIINVMYIPCLKITFTSWAFIQNNTVLNPSLYVILQFTTVIHCDNTARTPACVWSGLVWSGLYRMVDDSAVTMTRKLNLYLVWNLEIYPPPRLYPGRDRVYLGVNPKLYPRGRLQRLPKSTPSSQNLPPFIVIMWSVFGSQNLPLPPRIYPLFNRFACATLPESTPSSQNVSPFSTPICDRLRMYPSLPEFTPFSTTSYATLPEFTPPSQNMRPFQQL